MSNKKIKTVNVTDVINVTREMGDALAEQFHSEKDINVGKTSLMAYRTAIGAAKAQVVYKKLTGKPQTVAFFE